MVVRVGLRGEREGKACLGLVGVSVCVVWCCWRDDKRVFECGRDVYLYACVQPGLLVIPLTLSLPVAAADLLAWCVAQQATLLACAPPAARQQLVHQHRPY